MGDRRKLRGLALEAGAVVCAGKTGENTRAAAVRRRQDHTDTARRGAAPEMCAAF